LSSIQGQVDTSIVLDEFVIHAESLRHTTVGSNVIKLSEDDFVDTDVQTLPTALSENSGIYIKSYGLGSLSTSSIRGGSASHTLVIWNGIPLQSPMLGLLDLSLLTINSFEEISLEKGGQSAMWGSGAIGGVISLKNKQHQENLLLHVNTNLGSFGRRQYVNEIKFKIGQLASQTTLNIRKADNDFTYVLSDGITHRTQSNAGLNMLDIQQDLYYTLNDQNQISIHFWHQNTERQIPPTTVQSNSQAYQEDRANRLNVTWKRATENNSFTLRTASIHEELNYFDPAIRLSSPSEFLNMIVDSDYQWNTTIGTFDVGASYFYTQAEAAGYTEDIHENKSALFASYVYQRRKLKWQASLRQEWVNGENVPFIPSIGINYTFSNAWLGQMKLSRNYRIPTLNDRFWMPGGNIELKAESGWSQEASLEYNKKINNNPIHFSFTGYSRHINDWILWALLQNQVYFSAHNIAQVWSRGLEIRSSYTRRYSKGSLSFKIGYDFTKSTNQIAIEQPSLHKGEQLLYTPLHSGFISARFQFKKLNLLFHNQFVGSTKGINEDLRRFSVSNIRLQTNIQLNHFERTQIKLKFYFSINNVFNKNYRIIERRPMPERHFSGGIKLSFHK